MVPPGTGRATGGDTGGGDTPPMDVYRRLINRDLPWEERACTSKVQFVTRDEACSYLRSGRLTAGSRLRPYRCRFADHWHLGHGRRRHPAGGEAGPRPAPRDRAREEGPGWLAREWWSDRRRRHLRPARVDRSWRGAWASAA